MSNPRWRGINHLALITPDMDATVRFYHGALGMPIVATINAGPMRHYFFDMGAGQHDRLLLLVRRRGRRPSRSRRASRPSSPPSSTTCRSTCPSCGTSIDLQARLREHGVEVTELVDHGFVQSVYFTDPNGIALEASYWVTEPTGRPADYADGEMFGDTDPVPAVRELMATGELASIPSTRLVDEGADPA